MNRFEFTGQQKGKQIANIITSCRIVLSGCLLFCQVFSGYFWIVYLICGVTDMVDGTIARRTNTVSKFGANLDTIADITFLTVSLLKILPVIHMQEWLWIWAGIITVIKIGNNICGILCRKKMVSLHTISNKITGVCLFLLPLTIPFCETQYSIPVVCAIATVSAILEGYYIGTDLEIV